MGMPLRPVPKTWLVVVFAAMACAGCSTVGHSRVGIDNFDQVSPELFRGAQPGKSGMQTLAEYHVKTVINLRGGDDSSEAAMVREAGMTYLHLPLDAETVTVADAERFLAMLATAPGPVFVHCFVGRDRTGLAVAAYRIRVQGWSEQEALRDLYDHGHYWLLFPKVRGAISQLAQAPRPEHQLATAGSRDRGETSRTSITHASPNADDLTHQQIP
jgi:uncharacterized protein (TIGR01244 family)